MLFPPSGYVIESVRDGSAILLREPLSPGLLKTLASMRPPLTELSALWYGDTGDIRLLARIPTLKRLHINNWSDTDLSFISELKQLRALSIESTTRFDVDMGCWPLLEELSVVWSRKFEGLNKAPNLKTLAVWSWKEKDLRLLKDTPGLQALTLVRGPLRTMMGIEECKHLEKLVVSHMINLTDFSPIRFLKQLRHLEIDACRGLTNLSSFAPLLKLETLFLDNLHGVQSLEPLRKNPKLKRLYFRGTTNILDGNTAIINKLPIDDFAFQNRKHYDYKYNHTLSKEKIDAERFSIRRGQELQSSTLP